MHSTWDTLDSYILTFQSLQMIYCLVLLSNPLDQMVQPIVLNIEVIITVICNGTCRR